MTSKPRTRVVLGAGLPERFATVVERTRRSVTLYQERRPAERLKMAHSQGDRVQGRQQGDRGVSYRTRRSFGAGGRLSLRGEPGPSRRSAEAEPAPRQGSADLRRGAEGIDEAARQARMQRLSTAGAAVPAGYRERFDAAEEVDRAIQRFGSAGRCVMLRGPSRGSSAPGAGAAPVRRRLSGRFTMATEKDAAAGRRRCRSRGGRARAAVAMSFAPDASRRRAARDTVRDAVSLAPAR